MKPDTTSVIDVRDLVVDYGAMRAVRGVSFAIARGETLAIVGESGSGKSTTAMAVMRLLGPEVRITGSAVLQGAAGPVDLLAQDEPALRRIRGAAMSMVFQEPMTCLNPVMTVGAQIAEAVRLHQNLSRTEADAIALDSLRRARLTDAERRVAQYPHQLSGGMRQRVMIAMALACRPALLIADEPTTALDVTVQAEMLHLIRDLQQQIGMAVAYITHDLSVVAQIADRVLVMQAGEAVECQPVQALFKAPKKDYTRRLLASVPVLGSTGAQEGPVPFALGPHDDPRAGTGDAPLGPVVMRVTDLSKGFVMDRSPVLRRPTQILQALNGVSFDLRRGETIAIVGESGSGKSTMARAVMQLLRPDSGSVRLGGADIARLRGHALRPYRAQIQMVFQDPMPR